MPQGESMKIFMKALQKQTEIVLLVGFSVSLAFLLSLCL